MISAIIGGVIGLLLGAGIAALILRPANAALGAENAHHKSTIETLTEAKLALEADANNLRDDNARLRAERESLDRQIKEQKNNEDALLGRFENLSHKIFEAKSEKFQQQSKEGLSALLEPIREKFGEFQKKIDESFGEQAKEQRSLKDQIKNIVDANSKMTLQAESLTNALKGDSKIQGNWGEYMLEKILENSGLHKGEDYILQGSGLGLVNAETGKAQRPDVIVNLPEGKHIVIDSKLPLTSYERFFAETDDALRPAHLKAFTESVRARVRELEDSAYQDNDKLGTPDFVLMFVPIEGAYALAVQHDRDLHEYAWTRRVVIVCPTTLFATLRTVASTWRMARQQRNVQEIAKQGGALYDKIAGLVGDMEGLGRQLEKLGGLYDGAMKKLATGQGNIVTRVEKLRLLGAKNTKSIPAEFFTGDDQGDADMALSDETESGALEKNRLTG